MMRTIAAASIIFFAALASAQQAPNAAKDSASAAKDAPAKPFVYVSKPGDVVMGKPGAPVTMVEYASLSCPHCAHFYVHTLPDIAAKYIDTGKLKLIYRDFPLNDPAVKGAELIQCAPRDKREVFLKVLFTQQEKWAYDPNYKEALAGIAALGGIDRAAFDACMENKGIADGVAKVAQEAQNEYKVSSTPSFFLNGALLKGDHSLDTMTKAIEAVLNAKK